MARVAGHGEAHPLDGSSVSREASGSFACACQSNERAYLCSISVVVHLHAPPFEKLFEVNLSAGIFVHL
jgi:hypothetical protein